MYDVIGDVHGHHDVLVTLLERLDYRRVGDHLAHPNRTALFVGDLVDRGPRIPETVRLVRRMVDAGAARIAMGNHELNALAFHTPDPRRPGEFLRPHVAKNVRQHRETLDQFAPPELRDSLGWFRTLPRWLEPEGVRVVHACWDERSLDVLSTRIPNGEPIDDASLADAVTEGDPLFDAVETVLKGREVWLPDDVRLPDKDGHPRRKIRVRWFESPVGRTYRDYVFPANEACPNVPVELGDQPVWPGYPRDAPPVFFGHYWLSGPRPRRLAANVACVDYSVAKGGMLCAYRWNGEAELDDAMFATVSAPASQPPACDG